MKREIHVVEGYSRTEHKKVNVVDTIGFCDSCLDDAIVLDTIKEFIRGQQVNLDVVIVIVSGRIEKKSF